MPKFFSDFKIVIVIALTLLVTFIISYIVNRVIKKFIASKLEEKDVDVTNYKFLQHFASTIIFVVGFGIAMSTIPGFEGIGKTILASAGVLSLVIGVASQQSIGNMVSGVFIVIYKPFRINDKIKIEDKIGIVEDINLRHVILRDLENNRIIIPNSIISSQIIVNSHIGDEKCCKVIEIGISYNADVEKALELMQEVVANHLFFIDTRTQEEIEHNKPLVKARLVALDDSAVKVRVWAWAKNSDECIELYWDSLKNIKKEFQLNNIEIPFPQTVVTLKNASL